VRVRVLVLVLVLVNVTPSPKLPLMSLPVLAFRGRGRLPARARARGKPLKVRDIHKITQPAATAVTRACKRYPFPKVTAEVAASAGFSGTGTFTYTSTGDVGESTRYSQDTLTSRDGVDPRSQTLPLPQSYR
jgi:hypothetical protein